MTSKGILVRECELIAAAIVRNPSLRPEEKEMLKGKVNSLLEAASRLEATTKRVAEERSNWADRRIEKILTLAPDWLKLRRGPRKRGHPPRWSEDLCSWLVCMVEFRLGGEEPTKTNLPPILARIQTDFPDQYGGCKWTTLRAAYYEARPRYKELAGMANRFRERLGRRILGE
jgi:hypothetical protein